MRPGEQLPRARSRAPGLLLCLTNLSMDRSLEREGSPAHQAVDYTSQELPEGARREVSTLSLTVSSDLALASRWPPGHPGRAPGQLIQGTRSSLLRDVAHPHPHGRPIWELAAREAYLKS